MEQHKVFTCDCCPSFFDEGLLFLTRLIREDARALPCIQLKVLLLLQPNSGKIIKLSNTSVFQL
jgi:hypothetical protein